MIVVPGQLPRFDGLVINAPTPERLWIALKPDPRLKSPPMVEVELVEREPPPPGTAVVVELDFDSGNGRITGARMVQPA